MRPIVLLPTCSNAIGDEAGQSVLDAYLDAVSEGAGAQPLLVPSPVGGAPADAARLLALADGVLLTGSPSNVEPRHYGGPETPDLPHDPARDRLTLPLVRAAVGRGVPLLGICRGLQEINVALGGSLHPRVHASGFADHREPPGPPERQYAAAHEVEATPGGRLEAIAGRRRLIVNSLHGQGIDRLAAACRVEARAPDGLIEALSAGAADEFVFAVQWHPEWRWRDDPLSTAIFAAFGDAVRTRAGRR